MSLTVNGTTLTGTSCICFNNTPVNTIWACDTSNATCCKVWSKDVYLTVYPVTYNSTDISCWEIQAALFCCGSPTYGCTRRINSSSNCTAYYAGQPITVNNKYALSDSLPIIIEQSYSTTCCLEMYYNFGGAAWYCVCNCNIMLNCNFSDSLSLSTLECCINNTFNTYDSNGCMGNIIMGGDTYDPVYVRLIPTLVKTVTIKDTNNNIIVTCNCPLSCCYIIKVN